MVGAILNPFHMLNSWICYIKLELLTKRRSCGEVGTKYAIVYLGYI